MPEPRLNAGHPIRIFISYAREDSVAAERLYEIFAGHPDVDVWLDRRRLQPGDDWQENIRAAIGEADRIILLLSSQAIAKKGFIQREIREALDRALLLPPGERYVIPVRLDSSVPRHEELRRLQYVDMFPDWSEGVTQLCGAFSIRHYTHRYVALGNTKRDKSILVSLGGTLPSEHDEVKLVNLATLPPIDCALIPRERMRREGPARNLFIKLWTIASGAWPRGLYRKPDWNELDQILFYPLFGAADLRSESERANLAELVPRQWALARELLPYDEDDWRAMRKLIQQSRNAT